MKKYVIVCIVLFIILSSFISLTQPGNKQSMERGKKIYGNTCISCHQADGGGVQRMNPTLVKTKWILGDKKALSRIVLFGLKGGEIVIDGDDFHNPMPGLANLLTDEQIADVLTYVRNSFGNKATAVTVADVKQARVVSKLPVTKTIKKPAKQ